MTKGVKVNNVSSVDFVRAYAPLAREGKSALEIGNALGIQGDAKKVASYVSVKASQIRKQLMELAVLEAQQKQLDPEETEQLVQAMKDKLPRLKGSGRKASGEKNAIMGVLDVLNSL